MASTFRALRFLVYPLLVMAGDLLLTGVNYAAAWHWFATGWALAIVGVLKNQAAAGHGGHPAVLLLHVGVATAVVWAYQWALAGARISWAGALSIALLLVLVESVLLFRHLRAPSPAGRQEPGQ